MKTRKRSKRAVVAGFESSGEAVVYLRVSAESQAESGLGIEAQERLCREFCKREGLEIIATFADEGLSGSLPVEDRPELLAAVAACGKGVSLVVAKLDRLARDVVIAHLIERDLRDRGSRLLSATNEANGDDSPSGRLMRGILNLLSEYERATISWRTAQALAALRAQGGKTNSETPYGRRVSRVVEIPQQDGSVKQRTFFEDDPAEMAVIHRMRTQRKVGLSYGEIASRLEADRIPTRHVGGAWTAMTVRRIVIRELARYPEPDQT